MVEAGGISDFADPNDFYVRVFARLWRQLREEGVPTEEAASQAMRRIISRLTADTPAFAANLHQDAHRFHEEYSHYREGFSSRLRIYWGEALDRFENLVAIIEEGTHKFAHRNLGRGHSQETLFEILVQFTQQGVRVAREVHILLLNGFPLGALALSRTLHEIAVRASVISTFGSRPENVDLVERFVRHDDVINYRDALIFQRDADVLGYEKLSDENVVALKVRSDDALARFGSSYKSDYGWAAGLPGLPGRPTFRDLEQLAGLSHQRGLYSWSSHFVHADAKALRLSWMERGDRAAVLTNATNTRLTDPGQQAIRSLYRIFVATVTSAQPFSFWDHYLCGAISLLLDQVDESFVRAEEEVDDAEERFQAGSPEAAIHTTEASQ